MRKYGVPIGISVIVGSHHGKTPDECSDEIEEKIENYGKDVIFWTTKRQVGSYMERMAGYST